MKLPLCQKGLKNSMFYYVNESKLVMLIRIKLQSRANFIQATDIAVPETWWMRQTGRGHLQKGVAMGGK